jgi:hypothetical protein
MKFFQKNLKKRNSSSTFFLSPQNVASCYWTWSALPCWQLQPSAFMAWLHSPRSLSPRFSLCQCFQYNMHTMSEEGERLQMLCNISGGCMQCSLECALAGVCVGAFAKWGLWTFQFCLFLVGTARWQVGLAASCREQCTKPPHSCGLPAHGRWDLACSSGCRGISCISAALNHKKRKKM